MYVLVGKFVKNKDLCQTFCRMFQANRGSLPSETKEKRGRSASSSELHFQWLIINMLFAYSDYGRIGESYQICFHTRKLYCDQIFFFFNSCGLYSTTWSCNNSYPYHLRGENLNWVTAYNPGVNTAQAIFPLPNNTKARSFCFLLLIYSSKLT